MRSSRRTSHACWLGPVGNLPHAAWLYGGCKTVTGGGVHGDCGARCWARFIPLSPARTVSYFAAWCGRSVPDRSMTLATPGRLATRAEDNVSLRATRCCCDCRRLSPHHKTFWLANIAFARLLPTRRNAPHIYLGVSLSTMDTRLPLRHCTRAGIAPLLRTARHLTAAS